MSWNDIRKGAWLGDSNHWGHRELHPRVMFRRQPNMNMFIIGHILVVPPHYKAFCHVLCLLDKTLVNADPYSLIRMVRALSIEGDRVHPSTPPPTVYSLPCHYDGSPSDPLTKNKEKERAWESVCERERERTREKPKVNEIRNQKHTWAWSCINESTISGWSLGPKI